MPAVRFTITFTGRVQAVGFRATAQAIARSFAVTGWVRNEPDGSVTCVVEGNPPEVDRFRAKLESTMQRFIRDVRLERTDATGEFAGFRVAY